MLTLSSELVELSKGRSMNADYEQCKELRQIVIILTFEVRYFLIGQKFSLYVSEIAELHIYIRKIFYLMSIKYKT